MALIKYQYTVSQFLNNKLNPDKLMFEINASTIKSALDHINTVGDICDIWFKEVLHEDDPYDNDKITLDAIVANHDGELLLDQTPKMGDGRPIVRADSRPLGTSTYFTGRGDTLGVDIGFGKEIFWDFSNDDDLIAIPDPYTTMKRKRIDLVMNDPSFIKEGTLYWMNGKKGSYLNMTIVCPQGGYYLDRNGTPQYASTDVIVYKYVNHHHFAGDCPIGDELNSEGAQETATPVGYIYRLEITVPLSDTDSYGWGNLEMYRYRTYLYPGESAL